MSGLNRCPVCGCFLAFAGIETIREWRRWDQCGNPACGRWVGSDAAGVPVLVTATSPVLRRLPPDRRSDTSDDETGRRGRFSAA